eukprot:jgi/Undpi1/8863/HiC_scaffold_25.g11325.m1
MTLMLNSWYPRLIVPSCVFAVMLQLMPPSKVDVQLRQRNSRVESTQGEYCGFDGNEMVATTYARVAFPSALHRRQKSVIGQSLKLMSQPGHGTDPPEVERVKLAMVNREAREQLAGFRTWS